MGAFTLVQLGIQAVNAVTGIVIVRYLAPQQYAWLTIVLSMNAAFNVLTEPVTSTGLQALAGPVWQDRPLLGSLLRTAMRQRWKWLAVSALLLLPWTFFLLLKADASALEATLILLAALLAVPAVSGLQVQSTVPRLHSQLRTLQFSELLGSLTRLPLSLGALLLSKAGWLVMAATTASQWLQFWKLRADARPLIDPAAPASHEAGRKLDALMRSMALHSFFLCFQALVGIWLLGVFGSATAVAEFGALSRLAVVLAPLGALAQQMAVPALARCRTFEQHRALFLTLLSLATLLIAVLLAVCVAAPWSLLWILGPSYDRLATELPVAMGFFALGTLNTILWWHNTARGWTNLSSWVPVATLAVLGLVGWAMRPSTLLAILFFQLLGQMPSLLLALTQTFVGWKSLARQNG
ncbi:MAG: hypothetical protein ACOYOF_06525 [Verrucomicrobiaceae bacterium]